MDKIFDKIPYDFLAGVKPLYINLVGGVLVLSLAVAYYFLGHSPVQEEYAALEKTKFQTEAKLNKYQKAVAQKPFITAEVAAIKGTLHEKKRHLLLSREIPELLSQVSEVANFLGVEILNFRLSPTVSKDFYKEIPMSMTVYGDYYRTVGFFDSLQNLLRLLNVSHFQMDMEDVQEVVRSDEGIMLLENVARVQTTFQANTFVYIEGSEVSPAN